MNMNKFPLGQLLRPPEPWKPFKRLGNRLISFWISTSRGDWGEVSKGDKKLNDEALVDGSRLLGIPHAEKRTHLGNHRGSRRRWQPIGQHDSIPSDY